MPDEKRGTRSAPDLSSIDEATAAALVAYLNLPPVGALADADGPPTWAPHPSEIPEAVQSVLRDCRKKAGRFNDIRDIIAIPKLDAGALSSIIDRVTQLGRYGNRATPVWGGPEANRVFFELLESAEKHIHISTYIVGGAMGLRMADLLAEKIRQGVEVRLMFCASGFVISGSPSGTGFVSRFSELRSHVFNDMYVRKRIIERLESGNVPFLNTSPIGRHWKRRDFRKQGIKTASAYEKWARDRGIPDEWLEEQALIDRECGVPFANVDHRKMVIVDGERAFVGSQNLADSYFFDNELAPDPETNVRNWQWLDNSTVLEGPVVRELTGLFARRWMLSGGDCFDPTDGRYAPPPRRFGDTVVTIEASRPGMVRVPFKKNFSRMMRSFFGADCRPLSEGHNPIRDRMLEMPRLATDNYYVEHCYPSDSALLETWAALAPRIRDFTMVVPHHYDTKVLGMECDRMYPDMIASGARLHGYDRAIMHSKIAVVDDWYVSTGSYNLNLRSGRADLELEFFIQCPEYGAAVKRHIIDDMTDGSPASPKPLARYRSRFSLPVFDAVVRYLIL